MVNILMCWGIWSFFFYSIDMATGSSAKATRQKAKYCGNFWGNFYIQCLISLKASKTSSSKWELNGNLFLAASSLSITRAMYRGRECVINLSATASETKMSLKNSRGGILLLLELSMRKWRTKTISFSSANISFCSELILSIWCKLALMSDRLRSLVSGLIFLDFSVMVSYFISFTATFCRLWSFYMASFLRSAALSLIDYLLQSYYNNSNCAKTRYRISKLKSWVRVRLQGRYPLDQLLYHKFLHRYYLGLF